MIDFVNFILNKVYNPLPVQEKSIDAAFDKTVSDIRYHHPELTADIIQKRIVQNQNELAIFLFRLGEQFHLNAEDHLKPQIHWLMKELCGCEIYFNNRIDTGFYINHGEGTVIGSRNIIGKGFIIHQGCTIGHRKNGVGGGNTIGDNVTMYCNSSILGELSIGNNAVIGAHVLIKQNVEPGKVILNK